MAFKEYLRKITTTAGATALALACGVSAQEPEKENPSRVLAERLMEFKSSERGGCTIYKGFLPIQSQEPPYPGAVGLNANVVDCGERAENAFELGDEDLLHIAMVHSLSSYRQSFQLFDYGFNGLDGLDHIVRSESIPPNPGIPSGKFGTQVFMPHTPLAHDLYDSLLEKSLSGEMHDLEKEEPRTLKGQNA